MGRWIWARGVEPRNSYVYFRKVFQLTAAPQSATVKASADSAYRLYVNGSYVGQGPAKSGAGWMFYDTYDVASLLHKGDNVIAFLAHHVGENTYSYSVGKPGLLCKIEFDTDEGPKVIPSDESWKVRRADDWTAQGVRISKGLGFQEVYDSGLRLDNWNEVKFKDKDWELAEIVGAPLDRPWGDIIERQVPNLIEERVYPSSVVGVYGAPEHAKEVEPDQIADLMAFGQLVPIKAGAVKAPEQILLPDGQTKVTTPRGDAGVAILLDFGREVAGNVEIGIGGSTSGLIDIGYGELLEEGHVKPNRAEAKYTDRILLKKGRFEWRSFEPRAFRYLQIEFRRCGKPVAIDYVRVNQTLYPIEQAATFECSDATLNAIWKAGVTTARLCMQDTFLDSPRLERAQWWGDARILSRVAYYAFGDTQLLTSGLKQFARAQRRDGSMPGLYPSGEEKMVPDFALLWVFSILDYFAFSGDAGLVKDLYPSVKRLLEWFWQYRDQDGLLADVPGNPFIDWKEIDGRGNLTALNCLYCQALRVAAFIASIARRDSEAEAILADARALKMTINKLLYDPRHGLYATSRVDGKLKDAFDAQTNTLAVFCELPDQYQRLSILRWIGDGAVSEVATPYFASFVLEALYLAEKYDEALDFMKRRWGGMVAEGTGTLWEEFTSDGGLCQGWATSPTRDLIAEYIGIKPAMGGDRFSVAPHVGGLDWAMGSITTKHGELSVSWRRSRNQLVMRVVVPKGLRVDVYPPGPPEASIVLNGRPHVSRLLSLSGGTHQIKVTEPRPAKVPKPQPGLEPPPMPHVEVLDTGLRPRRALLMSDRRTRTGAARRGRGRGTAAEPAAEFTLRESEASAEVLPTSPEIEPPVELAPAVETSAETPVTPEEAQANKSRRRRTRSSRGGSRRKKTPDQEQAAEDTAQPQPAEAPEPVVPERETATEVASEIPTETAEPTEEKKPRRRRPRGGSRRRKPQDQAAEGETATSVEAAPPADDQPEAVSTPIDEPAEAAMETTDESKPRRRKSRSSRGGVRHRKPKTDQPDESAQTPEPPPTE